MEIYKTRNKLYILKKPDKEYQDTRIPEHQNAWFAQDSKQNLFLQEIIVC